MIDDSHTDLKNLGSICSEMPKWILALKAIFEMLRYIGMSLLCNSKATVLTTISVATKFRMHIFELAHIIQFIAAPKWLTTTRCTVAHTMLTWPASTMCSYLVTINGIKCILVGGQVEEAAPTYYS